jgi:hypothetical protein
MIDNVKTKLLQLEQINLELKRIFYELNKFQDLFLYLKIHFSDLIMNTPINSGQRMLISTSAGVVWRK